MSFNPKWVEDLLELQKKAEDLSKGQNASEKVTDLVLDALQQWGIPKFPWAEDLESMSGLWTKGVREQNANLNPDINLTETREEILIKVLIPGIKEENDLYLKLRGDILDITTKIPTPNNGNYYSRKIRLPAYVTVSGTKAVYKDGNLTISFPKVIVVEETIPVDIVKTQI